MKNAFVSALKNAGVDEGKLAGVREELGLSRSGSTKGLDLSTLKPLTRAQTREILDRFAGTINQNAGRTVVSNRWAALMSTNLAGYNNILSASKAVNQKTAETLAISGNYHIKVGQGVQGGRFMMDNNGGRKVGTVQYTYQVKVAGLESGNPQIASVGFSQDIMASDM